MPYWWLANSGEQDTVTLLDKLLSDALVDAELRWMVPWYYSITDYAFPKLESFASVRALVETQDPRAWQEIDASPGQFSNRGQMGDYWESVFLGEANRRSWRERHG